MLSSRNTRGHQLFLVMIPFLFILLPATVWSQTPVPDGNWNLLTDSGDVPSPRRWAAMTYNPACDETLLFGGYTPSPAPSVFDNHTYVRKNGIWADVTPANPNADPNYPKGRVGGEMVYDSRRGVMIMWGGYATSGENGNAVIYEYECSTQTWTKVVPSVASGVSLPGSSNYGHALAYDESRGVVVYFGGGGSSPYQARGLEYNPSTNEIYDACPDDPNNHTCFDFSPIPRSDHVMAYDKRNGYVIMYGGYSSNTYWAYTWIWDGSRWTRLDAASPGGRVEARLIYHPHYNRMFLVGGRLYSTPYFTDVWVWTGKNWVLLTPEPDGTETFTDRHGFRVVFDESMNRLFLFGGEGPTGHLNDSWEFQLYCDRYPEDGGSMQLFSRRCTELNGGSPVGVYDSMNAPVRLDGSRYFVSGTPDAFTQIAVDDMLKVEGIPVDLSCARSSGDCEVYTGQFEADSPIEDWIDPVDPILVGSPDPQSNLMNPNGSTLFELEDDAYDNLGNMPLHLIRDCSITVSDVPLVANGLYDDRGVFIHFLSLNGTWPIPWDAPMELEVVTGHLHELREDGDFSRSSNCRSVSGDFVNIDRVFDLTDFEDEPSPGFGHYYLIREVTDINEPVLRPFCTDYGFGEARDAGVLTPRTNVCN